jgi:hypothetical protein
VYTQTSVQSRSDVETEKYRKYIGRMCLYQPHGTASYRFAEMKIVVIIIVLLWIVISNSSSNYIIFGGK